MNAPELGRLLMTNDSQIKRFLYSSLIQIAQLPETSRKRLFLSATSDLGVFLSKPSWKADGQV